MITAANVSAKEQPVMATLFFNTEQTRGILKDAGPTGLAIMQYYVAIGKQPNPNMEDNHIAQLLAFSISTVKKSRLALTKAGWFKRVKNINKGELQVMYLVGKTAVSSSTHAVIQP